MSSARHISMTYSKAIKQAKVLSDCAADIGKLEKKLDGILGSLRSGWAGEAADSYQGKCGELERKLGLSSSELSALSKAIRDAAEAYYEAEMAALEAIKSRTGGGGGGGGGRAW